MGKYITKKKLFWLGALIIVIGYAIYGFHCARLAYWQTIQLNGSFPSDTPVHIKEALKNDAYSLMEYSLAFIVRHIGNYKILGAYLGMYSLLTAVVTGELIYEVSGRRNRFLSHLFSLLCIFSMAYYCPSLNDFRYLGVQSGNVYHNSTYLGMKLFGTLALLLYFRYQKIYEKGLKPLQWCAFMLSLVLVCTMKPNFLVCFAPAMGIYLLIDLIRKKGKTFPKIFLFGLAVIPCVIVLVYEYTSLFPSGEGGGLEIDFAFSISQFCRNPWAGPIQTLLFPLWVLIFHIKDLKKDHAYGFSWMMSLIAFLEYLFIVEAGSRKTHGNLSWGYCYCIFVLFVISSAKLISSFKKRPIWFYIISLVLWAGHILAGINYFQNLLMGGYYY